MSIFMSLQKKKKPKIQKQAKSLRELIPIKDIRRGILFTDTDAIKFLEILPVNFQLKSEREQDAILSRYEDLFKIMKCPFMIFTIAKKSDASAHLDYIKGLFEREKNDNVRSMMVEYMENTAGISYQNAVRRRFIVAIPYQAPAGLTLQHVTLNDIESYLYQKSSQFKDAISSCGNDVVIPEDENAFTSQILMELLNVKSSEKQKVVGPYAAV